jgi:hypothetical protein
LDKLFISAIKLFPISFDDRSEFIKKLASQINSEEVPDQNKDMKPKELFTPTPDLIKSTGVKMDSQQENKPTPTSFPASTPVPEIQKSRKNLEESEVTMLQEKIKLASNELTPRQIRILIYRYLLARNLWISFYNILDWRAENAIDEIMRFSDLNGLDPKAQTTINGDLSKIARMVVAY